MKKYLLSIMVVAISISLTLAQTPATIVTKFKTDYPEANAVEWKSDGELFTVTFTDRENMHHMIVYDEKGVIRSRESEVNDANVPSSIKEYYSSNYPQQKGSRVWLSENEAGNKVYYSPIDDAVLFFDKDGKFSRQEPRTSEVMQPKN
ncbi:MAG: PepSY-like domain-containing protein [Chitinophagales bacterium]